MDTIVREGHSRIPVYEGSIDRIFGILYAKDLLRLIAAGGERPRIRDIMRPALFVPESQSVDDLLHELQRRKVHMAIVLDEYGGTAGLVTIEDLLEEIVGEIQDEFDEEEPMKIEVGPGEAENFGDPPSCGEQQVERCAVAVVVLGGGEQGAGDQGVHGVSLYSSGGQTGSPTTLTMAGVAEQRPF